MKRLLWILLLLCFTGCQSKPTGFPDIVPCSVIVTDDGKPIAGVSVSLHSATPVKYFSGGITDENGVAEIKTSQGNRVQKGIPHGKAVLVLTKTPEVDDWKTLEEQGRMSTEELMAYSAEKQRRSAKLPPVIPKQLTDAKTSPLVKDIVSGQSLQWKVDIAELKK
ncbi:MAG: Ig-like domain-containing protein [Planctomycetaceae bacterium]|nr:Ig-like domain-containing protein [Planctomycetaceae bacterium]